MHTAYLRVKNNIVSDIVTAETKDLVKVEVKVSYRVNFEDDPQKWFDIENYVKFLTDHIRSLIKNAARRYGIEEFNARVIDIVRDTVLGVSVESKRPGRSFKENGMHVYDVEVLDIKIGDSQIAQLLVSAQHDAVKQAIDLAQQEKRLEVTKRTEVIQREIDSAKAQTATSRTELEAAQVTKNLELTLAKVMAEARAAEAKLNQQVAEQAKKMEINSAELAREKARSDQELAAAKAELDQRLEQLKAEVLAVVDKAKAVSPDLIAALQAFGDKALAEKMAESMSPLAILGGRSIADVFAQLLAGTPLANVLFSRDGAGKKDATEKVLSR